MPGPNFKETKTILLTIAGSRAYGIHRPGSDVDLKGILVPEERTFFCPFDRFDQTEDVSPYLGFLYPAEIKVATETKLEGVVYGLMKFISLATENNPNILDLLYCREEEVRICTPLGRKLRENRDLFLSTKARFTFTGYAVSQLQRMKRHRAFLFGNYPDHKPTRAEFGLPEHHKTVKAGQLISLMNLTDRTLTDLGVASEMFSTIRYEKANTISTLSAEALEVLGISEEGLNLLKQEVKYALALKDYRGYEEWLVTRNQVRSELEAKCGYDAKNAGHLVRLMKMGTEIMETGQVHVWRGGIDREEILEVREGRWAYDKLIEWAEGMETKIAALYNAGNCPLPKEPQRTKIRELCIEMMGEALKGKL